MGLNYSKFKMQQACFTISVTDSIVTHLTEFTSQTTEEELRLPLVWNTTCVFAGIRLRSDSGRTSE